MHRTTNWWLLIKLLLSYLLAGVLPLLLLLNFLTPTARGISPGTTYILIGLSAGIGLVSALIVYLKTTQTLNALTEICNQLESGNLELLPKFHRAPIINRLLKSLAAVAGEMRRIATDLKYKENRFNSIINSISEGLLLIDENGQVLLTNTRFQQIVGKDNNLKGKFYWEIIREPQLAKILSDSNLPATGLTTEIEIAGRTFLGRISPIPTTHQRLILLNDISEIVRTEKMKKDFIVNVSHELRTPLTAIKGYVETMEETIDADNRVYLQIIKRHTERLIALVSDLLLLSRLEDRIAPREPEDVNLAEIIANVVVTYKHLAEKKGLKLITAIEPDIPIIKGDPLQLEQAFLNLLDNAIRYTEQGTITLKLMRLTQQIAVSIADTGIGIPEHHLPRIFERFYVVDRSRSRQTGGTGLGLAIVKHIIAQHNGEVRVESTPGRGSKFTVLLPI